MNVFLAAAYAAFVGTAYYVITPTLALDSLGFWFLVFLLLGVPGLGGLLLDLQRKENHRYGASRGEFVPKRVPGLLFSCSLVALAAWLVLALASMPMLRSDAYRNLLGVETEKDFSKSLPPIDVNNAPLVSQEMAMRAAEKKLSEIPALGSQARVGQLQKQRIKGELYWVAFLEHRGLFTYLGQGYTPGYVKVSATDASDVELVTEVAGKKLALRYLDSAYFGSNAERMLRFSGYATTGLADFSAEVDDEGRPFMVVTVFDRKVGGRGEEATGVVVLDVQTGQHQFYPVQSAPSWVDRVQPEEFVREQVADRLEYVNGWLNPSNKDKLSISGDVDVVYGSDGEAYFYVGLTSVGRDGGLVGFMLVNTRSKEVTRYSLTGVTEGVAQAAAEGVMPEKKYRATNGLPFLVGGQTPAYVMALQDSTGIARAYAVVDIRDYQRVAVADTLQAAVRNFQSKLNIDRTSVDAASRPNEVVLKAKVVRIGQEVRQGNSTYVFMLEGHAAQLFEADINRAEDLVVTKEGDLVELSTVLNGQRVAPVLSFKNLTLELAPKAARPEKP